jgi:serine/threonine protein kinase
MAPSTDQTDDLGSEDSGRGSVTEARIGSVVGGTYRITRHIGSGGSSHVFEAEHQRLGSSVAVKLLRPDIESGRKVAQRFRREARAMARLHSEHIVSVLDCGELDDGTPYLVMELLEGEDLRSLLNREGSLPVRRAVQIVIEACRGLTVVHDAGLVHRDLKPENLFIARRSTGEDWCKVLDFGVAKMEASLSTAEGAIVGTVRYMAPEQLSDGASVGPATDLYALGAILYECLSGQAAHSGETIHEVMFGVINTDPEALSAVSPNIPRALVAAVTSCLAKGPVRRPRTAEELEQLLSTAFAAEPRASSNLTLAEDGALPLRGVAIAPLGKWRIGVALTIAAMAGAAISWSAKPNKLAHSTNSQMIAMPAPPPLVSPSEATVLPATPVVATISDTVQSNSSAQRSRSTQAAAVPVIHRALSMHSVAVAARPPGVSVGSLDQANPYGE